MTGTDLWADFGNGSQPAGGDNAVGINGTYSGYIYADRAVAVITEHGRRNDSATSPMFMYLALHNIHGPDEVTEEFLGLYLTPANEVPVGNTSRLLKTSDLTGILPMFENIAIEWHG